MTLDSNLKKTRCLLIHWSNLSSNGKKSSPENQKSVCEKADDIGNEFSCDEVHACIEKELSGDTSPYAVFDNVLKFTSLITDIRRTIGAGVAC